MKTIDLPGKVQLYLSGIVILVFLSQCNDSPGGGSDTTGLDSLTTENYPKVDGSTSAHPLQVLIACKLLDVEYSWMNSWDETYRIWPSFEEKPEIAQFIVDSIVSHGTHEAFVNLINGMTDLILVAREASADEISLADSVGVELTTKPVALDAFVFIVNIHNPVSSLTEKQIQDIYTGNITRWSEVGGTNTAINPYQRNPNSGSQELMMSLVMKELTMINAPDMILYSMMGPINMITEDRDGLGYTVYFYEQFMAPHDSLKLVAVNDVLPEKTTLRNQQYIYTAGVYAVVREDLDRQSLAYQLYLWLSAYGGQKVVSESGYIPYYY